MAVRFDASGKPDATFGQDGVAHIDLGTGHPVAPETFAGADRSYGSAVLSKGGIAIFGHTTAGADRLDSDYALVGLTIGRTRPDVWHRERRQGRPGQEP